MKIHFALGALLASCFMYGCGDNIENIAPVTQSNAPTGIKALSVNQTTVQLQWSASFTSSDSNYLGYMVQAGTKRDTLSRATLTFVADTLPSGVSLFSIYTLKATGALSDPGTIRWAPAERFNSAFNVYERNSAITAARPDGFDVGTSTVSPAVFAVDSGALNLAANLDLFFNGDSALTQQSLSMWSANLLVGSFNHTLFSTQTDAGTSLDVPLAAFPAENTFVKDSIAAINNTIYYVKVVGDFGQFNYARVHLQITGGYPNRIVHVRVSLQRVAGLSFAFDTNNDARNPFGSLHLLRRMRG